MAKPITFTFDVDIDYNEWVDSVCQKWNYKTIIPDPNRLPFSNDTIPNPETKEQFAKRMTIEKWFKSCVISVKAPEKAQIAENEEKAKIEKWKVQ